jgi:hypothetical protein
MMRIGLNPSHPNNDWFEELCALAAIGELSSTEFAELQHHLTECGRCRALYADFRRISSDDIGLAAIQEGAIEEVEEEDADGALNEEELLSRFLERARSERVTRTVVTHGSSAISHHALFSVLSRIWSWLRSPVLAYGSLGVLLAAAASVGTFQLRDRQLSAALADLRSQLNHWRNQAEVTAEREKSATQLLQQSQFARDALQRSLAEAQAKYAELQAQQKALRTELAASNVRLEQLSHDLQAAKTGAEQKERLLAELQAKLQGASLRTEEQEAIVARLGRKLRQAEREASASTNPREDTEAKNLFGARDLHIVDVYDVDSTGKTRRTYGRVYYVEKKLLVFYAFDLQDKGHNRTATGFQAWGYRQANASKAEDLGLFYVDDASLNRWVLKVNNPRVLERIDAVFVTLEPASGSAAPRGRKVLYANLGGPPNHP